MKKLKEPTRIFGILLICFALFTTARAVRKNVDIIGLTPEKCTMETEGTTVDYVRGAKAQYGTSRGHVYDVYYDVIEYVVDNQTYQITSKNPYASEPVIGAMTTVHYNPNNPSKAYDNSAPYVEKGMYFYPVMYFLMGLFLVLGLDKRLKKR